MPTNVQALSRAGAFFAFAAAACALANLATMLVAVRFDVARLHDFGALVDVDDAGARWLVASMIVDAGFYASLVPVALALARDRREPSSWPSRALRGVAGVAYALVGCAGALVLAASWPALFAQFDAGGAAAERAAAEFRAITDAVYLVVWNVVCAGVGAVWWLATAHAVWRARPRLARAALALGAASLAQAVSFGVRGAAPGPDDLVAGLLLNAYLGLLVVFALAAGASLRARP